MAQSARQFEPGITVTGCNTVSEIGAQSVVCAKVPDRLRICHTCPMMKTARQVAAFIEQQAEMMRLLRLVTDLRLAECWIGGGFIRDAVWDALHDRMPDCTRLNDVDVVLFDRSNVTAAHDEEIERELAALCPNVPWSVKNQARMHIRNRVPPYPDISGAIASWPETATAVAARLDNGHVTLLAPHGVGDLVNLIVRPTPAFVSRRHEIAARVSSKNWQAVWPRLTLLGIQARA
jgi:hypothetical protein